MLAVSPLSHCETRCIDGGGHTPGMGGRVRVATIAMWLCSLGSLW